VRSKARGDNHSGIATLLNEHEGFLEFRLFYILTLSKVIYASTNFAIQVFS